MISAISTIPYFDKKFVKADFERAANNYNDYADLQRMVALEVLAIGRENFVKGDKLLDLGCGTGFLTREAPFICDITQIDLANAMCHKSKDCANVINGDMEELPLIDNYFDGVISSLALQWSSDPHIVFSESKRVMKDGAVCIYSTLGPATLQELREVFLTVHGYDHVSHFYDRDTIKMIAESAGLNDVEVRTKIIELFYPDAITLMKKVRGVGAGNKQPSRRKIITKTYLNQIIEEYQDIFGTKDGIPATWEVLYLTARK